MYGKIIIITILLTSTLCYGQISTNEDHGLNFYHELSLKERINNTLKIQDAMKWFEQESVSITFIAEKQNKYISVTYKFYNKEPMGYLQLFYNNENECEHITLKFCINGTYKIYHDDEAKRMLISFVSYNDEFEYHSID